MDRQKERERARAAGLRPVDAAELLQCRGGGGPEDDLLWLILGPYQPPPIPMGTGPTFPA